MKFDSLALALAYLARHPKRYIFPIKAGKKFPPLLKDNLDGNASNDPDQIRAWVKQFGNGVNWGLAHRKSKTMVVDVDTNAAKGKVGQKTFDILDLEYGWPATETTTTPSGGMHLIYEGEHVFALGENGIGKDIDSPNYTLIPGSQFDNGTEYVGNGAASVAAPAWIYDIIKGSKAKNKAKLADAGEVVIELDKPENIELAIDFLKEDAVPAIEGQGGDFNTLKTAMYLKDVGISPAMAVDLLVEYYNPRCEPEWAREELEQKVSNAFNYSSLSKAGGKTAEADFDGEAIEAPPEAVMGIYDRDLEVYIRRPKEQREQVAQRRAALAIKSAPGAPPPGDITPKLSKLMREWGYVMDLERFVKLADSTKMWSPSKFDRAFAYLPKGKSLSDALLKRRDNTLPRFVCAVYQPGQPVNVNGDFNMYVQPDIAAVEGDLTWWNDHLEYLLPDASDRAKLLNWMAWLVQNIGKKPKHAMLLQGTVQGTGKSFIVEMLARIIGMRNVANINQSDLHGDFNGWAARSKLLVIEELRAVDRTEVANKLHPLITQDIVSVNEKNLPRRDVENCFGIFAMSNHDAAVTLDPTDRRYLVITSPATPRYGKDTPPSVAYYKRLYGRLYDRNDIAAVAFMLMNRDVGLYDGAAGAPVTAAKTAMIKSGQSDIEHFFDDNADNYPFTCRVIRTSDVMDALPTRLQRGGTRLMSTITSLLKARYNAIELPQITVDGKRCVAYAIGSQSSMLAMQSPKALAAIYEKDMARAKKNLPIADDEGDAGDEFDNAE